MWCMRARPAVAERLLTAALVDLGDSLEHLGEATFSTDGPSKAVCASPDLLDGYVAADARDRYLTAGKRAIDVRWGELLYDLASSAFSPWGSSYPASSVALVAILRCATDEAHVIVRADGVHIFQFPYATWPSGIHAGAWDVICALIHEAPHGRVHRCSAHGWGSRGPTGRDR